MDFAYLPSKIWQCSGHVGIASCELTAYKSYSTYIHNLWFADGNTTCSVMLAGSELSMPDPIII